MSLSAKEKQITSHLLKEYSKRLGNDGCNDWSFPTDWTVAEKQQFIKEYYAWNGSPEDYSSNHLHLPNFSVAAFLAYKLEKKNNFFGFKIASKKAASEQWVKGYLSDKQIEDILCLKEESFPVEVFFGHNGMRDTTQVYGEGCSLLLNITEYED